MKAISRSLRITPKKLNLIAAMVRNKDVNEAMTMLDFMPKKGAKILNKVIHSAVANAENNFKQDRNSLYIKEIVVGKGTTFKRSVPVSRGSMHPILKRNSHVWVTVGVREAVEGEAPKVNKIEAKAAKAATKMAKAKPAKKAEPKKQK